MKHEIVNRIAALRYEMQKLNIDAWYISGTDPHSSEYLPERWKTRAFISGFTGSYGVVVVTHNEAALWTDSRYFIQATEELEGTGISMMKLRVPDAISPERWLAQHLSAESKVGMDTQTVTVSDYIRFKNKLVKDGIELVETPDLLGLIWSGRPDLSKDQVFELELKYAGKSRQEKYKAIVAELEKKQADLLVVSMLDELAWLYNLRGTDIPYNPVFTGYALVGREHNTLFIDPVKISDKLKTKLESDSMQLKAYGSFSEVLKTIRAKKIAIDPSTLNYATYNALSDNNDFVNGTSPIALLKAQKSDTEINGFRKAMQKDGVAMVELIHWLKQSVGKQSITDYEVGLKLAEFRSKQEGFQGESFPPIVGYKDRGAIVHLHVEKEDAQPIEADGALLFDSGGQYLDGTTDITRTIALGKVSDQFKKDFTLVLKGMIGLTLAKFPYGTKGCHLDILARKALWENGMNYGHGTGHGVGHFLNVHEGPMAIRQEYNENKIESGHVISNEPAFYRESEYGIRTENLIVCVEKETTEFGRFLGFDTLTLCPIDASLIKLEMLTTEEKSWLNEYHTRVKEALKPLMNEKYHSFLDKLTEQI